ncbi:MAG: DUF2177 family protein [Clostridia bacterium]|nr:DUF2177 family protein [Clostridia bacterium]MBN2882734.1 DUF2177 family protein [Clostridia bacterium]
MGKVVVQFLVAFGVFMVIDFIWLVFVAAKLYNKELGALKKKKVNWPAAILFYILYIIGLVFFVLNPALAEKGIGFAAYGGALFGLVAYATYDLTNLATLEGFPTKIAIIDLIWGTCVTCATAVLSFLIL